jgi:branched-chain amino acid aminotransferase
MATMAEREGWIWLDGDFLPWQEAKVHVLTHTLHYGMGIFEGLRAYDTPKGTAIFRLHDHTDRFFRSAKIINLSLPFSKDVLNQAQCDIIKKNNLKSGYIRPLCFLGAEGLGLHTSKLKAHIMIAAWDWGAYLGKENLEKGIKVGISSFTRHHVNITMTKAKITGNYVNSMLAINEAKATGFDEALLLDVEGYVAEGSGENFFMVRNGVLHTPRLTSCLEGITRDTILTLAMELGISVKESSITRDEVYTAEECFFTGTAVEVTPIREVDGRSIGAGKRGPITEQLQSRYFDIVQGKEKTNAKWLTFI